MIINVGGGSAGYNLAVTVTGVISGTTVTVTKDDETYTKTVNSTGSTSFSNLKSGTWTVTATNGNISETTSVNIEGDSAVTIKLRGIPEFTYSGSYELVNDTNSAITDPDTYQGNWKIKFKTGGNLKFTKLNQAATIDVFCVGGGAPGSYGGGGAGYTNTVKNIKPNTSTTYVIVVGGSGGDSSAFGVPAAAGLSNGTGGSGGGGRQQDGGTNGSDGGPGDGWQPYGQKSKIGPNGEGTKTATYDGNTREFGESTGQLYSGGGGGCDNGKGGDGGGGNGATSNTTSNAVAGKENTGGGGGGIWGGGAIGGSGIVIIRNAREAA